MLIETYNSTNGDTQLAVRVTKEPMGGGRYRLLAAVWCDNWIGCFPNKWDALLDFNKTVGAIRPNAQPAAIQPAISPPVAAQPEAVQPAIASRAQLPAPTPASSTPQEEKLRELKRLYDAGLISQEIYLERQRKILEGAASPAATTEGRPRGLYVIPNPR